MTDYKALKVTDLKAELARRNLPLTGKKEDLIARLAENDNTQTKAPASALEPSVPKPTIASDSAVSVPLPNISVSAEGPTKNAATASEDKTDAKAVSKEALEAETAAVEAKLRARAARFGNSLPTVAIPSASSESASAELEKRKQRAARFGIPLAEEVALQKQAKKLVQGSTPTQPRGDARRGDKHGQQRKQGQAEKKPNTNAKPAEMKRSASVMDDPEEAEKARKRMLKYGNAATAAV